MQDTFSPILPLIHPLSPFPPKWHWITIDDMLNETLADLRIPWIKDYLLHPNPLRDAEILSDPARVARAMPDEFLSTARNEDGSWFGEWKKVLFNVPAFSRGLFGAGVAVQTTWISDVYEVVHSDANVFIHFVTNGNSGAQLAVLPYEALGKVALLHMKQCSDGWKYALLVFDAALFQEAFRYNNIDFSLVKRALMDSVVGGTPMKEHSPVRGQFPFRLADNWGKNSAKSVFSSYVNATPLMALPVFSNISWSYECNIVDLCLMQEWGMKDRVRRIKIRPSNNAPSIRIENSVVHEPNVEETEAESNAIFQEILGIVDSVVTNKESNQVLL